jgi:hypothetical protein
MHVNPFRIHHSQFTILSPRQDFLSTALSAIVSTTAEALAARDRELRHGAVVSNLGSARPDSESGCRVQRPR